jgi:hypothetical protein
MNVKGYSLPGLTSLRGAGLGNELIPWGKALLAAHRFGLRPLHPAWAFNPRGYRAEFETSRLDWPAHEVLKRVGRRMVITREDVRSTGASDYLDALEILTQSRALRGPLVMEHASGMHGGYRSIRAARALLLREILRPRAAAEALYALGASARPDRLTVGFHVRSGDFETADEIRPGVFNVALPQAWYISVAERLAAEFEGEIEAIVVSDGDLKPLANSLRRVLPVVDLRLDQHTAVGDLATLAACDALVCSISSYSLAAAFLSDRPYIWFVPHLNAIGGWLSLWGHEEDQHQGPTASASQEDAASVDVGRGVPLGWDDPLPAHAVDLLSGSLVAKEMDRDLIYYGVVRATSAAGVRTPLAEEGEWRS